MPSIRRAAHVSPGKSLGAYLLGEQSPRCGVQPLGIVDTHDVGPGREHHRCGYDRAGKRTHARFVRTCDVAHAGLPQQQLEVPHGLEAQALLALALEAFLSTPRRPLHTLVGA